MSINISNSFRNSIKVTFIFVPTPGEEVWAKAFLWYQNLCLQVCIRTSKMDQNGSTRHIEYVYR